MGGSSKPPGPSDQQRKMEKQQMELMEIQLAQAKKPIELPKIEAPKPLPPPPPPAMETGESAQAAEEERRKAARRTNTGRNTIFAGENKPAARSTLLG